MIKIAVDKGETKELEINGDLVQITTETTCIIRDIWMALKHKDAEAAEEYKRLIIKYIEKPFMSTEDLLDDLLKRLLSVDD